MIPPDVDLPALSSLRCPQGLCPIQVHEDFQPLRLTSILECKYNGLPPKHVAGHPLLLRGGANRGFGHILAIFFNRKLNFRAIYGNKAGSGRRRRKYLRFLSIISDALRSSVFVIIIDVHLHARGCHGLRTFNQTKRFFK